MLDLLRTDHAYLLGFLLADELGRAVASAGVRRWRLARQHPLLDRTGGPPDDTDDPPS